MSASKSSIQKQSYSYGSESANCDNANKVKYEIHYCSLI